MSEVQMGHGLKFSNRTKEILSLMEVEFDLIKERVRVKLSPTRYWITPIHTSVYQALEERVMKIISTAVNPNSCQSIFATRRLGDIFYLQI